MVYHVNYDIFLLIFTGSGERYLPSENPFKHRSYKSIFSNDLMTIRLYNVGKDPREIVNLAAKHPTKVNKMLRKLRHFQKESVDPIDYKLDEKSDPALFGGVWTPWMDEE